MTKIQWVALIAVLIIAIGGYLFPQIPNEVVKTFGNVSSTCQGSTTCLTDLYISDAAQFVNGITVSSTAALNILSGTTVTNEIEQGSAGYSYQFNTATAATSTFTAGQFCGTTSILVPVGATTSTGIIFPNATTTYVACGVTAPGSWETQIVENESSYPMIIATTSTGWVFMASATSTASGYKYPPEEVPASTTETFIGIPTSASSWEILTSAYSHASGQ